MTLGEPTAGKTDAKADDRRQGETRARLRQTVWKLGRCTHVGTPAVQLTGEGFVLTRKCIGIALWLMPLLLGFPLQTHAQAAMSKQELQREAFYYYREGVAAFDREEFGLAAKNFAETLYYWEDSVLAQKYLIISLYRSGEYTAAIDRAEAFLDTTSDDEVRLALAFSFAREGNVAKARPILQSLAEAGDEEIKKLAVETLTRIDEAAVETLKRIDEAAARDFFPRPKGVSGYFTLGPEYNSNVRSSASEGSQEPSDEGAWLINSTLSVDYDFEIGDRFFAGPGFLATTNVHDNDARDFDFQVFRGDVHAGVVGKAWRFEAAYEHERVLFDYETEIVRNAVELTHTHVLTQRFITIAQASVSFDDFPKDDDQDATLYEFRSLNRLYVPELIEGSHLKLRYRFKFNDTQHRSVFQYYANAVGVGFYSPLPWWATYVDLDLGYEIRRYDDRDPDRRIDRTFDAFVAFGKEWSPALRTEIYYSRLDRDSTVSDFNKKENIFGMNGTYSF